MSILFSIIPWWGRLLAIVAVLVAAAGFGAVKMRAHDAKSYEALQLAYSDFKGKVQAEGEMQQKQTQEVIAKQKSKTQEVQSDYEKKLADIRSYYARRLRDAGSGSGQVPALPAAAQGVDGSSAYYELAAACAETTQQLISLQDWVRAQGG